MRLIDADKLLPRVQDIYTDPIGELFVPLAVVTRVIAEAETVQTEADTRRVNRFMFECKCCGGFIDEANVYNYCPYCGAKFRN